MLITSGNVLGYAAVGVLCAAVAVALFVGAIMRPGPAGQARLLGSVLFGLAAVLIMLMISYSGVRP